MKSDHNSSSWVELRWAKNPSLAATVWHHSASLVMPDSDPWDRFFYTPLTPMIYSYILHQSIILCCGYSLDLLQERCLNEVDPQSTYDRFCSKHYPKLSPLLLPYLELWLLCWHFLTWPEAPSKHGCHKLLLLCLSSMFKVWNVNIVLPFATLVSQIWLEYLSNNFNLYHFMGKFSRQQINDIFLIFPRKQDMTFHANFLH